MATDHDTLLRHLCMLRNVPRYPNKITANDLNIKIAAENFLIDKRSVQRDLIDLSLNFPLALDDRSKPYGWSWQKDAPSFSLPGLSDHEALTIMMVEQHLKQLMPTTVLDVMSPYFKASKQALGSLPKSKRTASWLSKVRSVPPMQPLLAPKISPEVHDNISMALLSDQQVAITYQARGKEKTKYRIHPLALVQRGTISYLYVLINDYKDTRILAIHRILDATILDDKSSRPTDFDIDSEIAKGRFGFGDGDTIKLKAKFSSEAGDHLYETPLSEDQKIIPDADGALVLTATVADTPQLLWWLLSMGEGVEVLSPKALRSEIGKILVSAAKKYK